MNYRTSATPLEWTADEFRNHAKILSDRLSKFLEGIETYPVTSADTPEEALAALGTSNLPEEGIPGDQLLMKTADDLIAHSLFNGHPKFFGFITSSPTHIGILADMLAAAINPNVGGQILSPIATEIEKQTVKWLAQFVGYPDDCGGILTSGGNMANFIGFLAGTRAMLGDELRTKGLRGLEKQPLVYTSSETHTWVEKAADLFGFGTDHIRYVPVNRLQEINTEKLGNMIREDRSKGFKPIMICGTAGSVSTGAIDDLMALRNVADREGLWYHVDGAYGAMVGALNEYQDRYKGMRLADSVALDPHKWLYSPLEAGATLVKDKEALHKTFSFHPPYYYMTGEESSQNYHEYGMQNSRGFRALKVWMAFRQVGAKSFRQMIREDIDLARLLFELVHDHPNMQGVTHSLSITCFRYVPDHLKGDDEAVNQFNQSLLEKIQLSGKLFLSNAIIDGKFCLRACIVNFRTREGDIRALPDLIEELANSIDH